MENTKHNTIIPFVDVMCTLALICVREANLAREAKQLPTQMKYMVERDSEWVANPLGLRQTRYSGDLNSEHLNKGNI